ncbi:DNA endonuclease RBBP8 [Trichuris trichiura]|uniref:DNA endonuclease RBBP8 n=1 Tax=Trichuris trichiura TaxID=36087 RepID=A0A077Z9P0_TRITR|nr:DNA endonuclease RBBP8 [Trichuris trichiura]
MSMLTMTDRKVKRCSSCSRLSCSSGSPQLNDELHSLEISGNSSPELFSGYSDILRQRGVQLSRPVARDIFRDKKAPADFVVPVSVKSLANASFSSSCSEHLSDTDEELGFHTESSQMKGRKIKYVNSPVRKRIERKKLVGYSCNCCREYFESLNLSEKEAARRLKAVSRHRDFYVPPKSPDHFWEVSFPSTPELIERGWLNLETARKGEN